MTITRIMSATPSAIDSPVSEDANARCCMFRQAIFQKDMRERSGVEGQRVEAKSLNVRGRSNLRCAVDFFQVLDAIKLIRDFWGVGYQEHCYVFLFACAT